MSDTYAAYLLALAETPAKHAIVAHVDAYIMAANAQKARIRELEACVLEYWNAKDWNEIVAADDTAAKLLPLRGDDP